jgi:hypothetical protein
VIFYNAIQPPLTSLRDRIYGMGRVTPKSTEIASYEDVDHEFARDPIVIVRSFYNVMASRIRGRQRQWAEMDLDVAMELWPEHARHHTILFDLWYQDDDYCRMVEIGRDWPSVAPNRQTTARIGWGSSFGDERFKHDRNVLERWRDPAVTSDPAWLQVLGHQEARDLNFRLFGWALSPEGELLTNDAAVG